jgi:glycine cleavage system aminomethyltransferase T
MEARGGWQVPVHYGSTEAEKEAARTSVAVAERIGLSVIEVVGSGVGRLAETLNVGAAAVGEAARMEGETTFRTWCRLTRDHARVISEPGDAWPQPVADGDGCLHVCDVSSGYATLLVAGPRAVDLLARLVRLDLDPRVFGDRRVLLTGAAGIPVQLVRWDRSSLPAYELMLGRDVAEYFAETLFHAGSDLGLQLIGADAIDP